MQGNWFAMIKAVKAEAAKQAPTPVQPAEAPATQSFKPPWYCAICTPIGKICPHEYPIHIAADWPDNSEEEKGSPELQKDKDNFSDIQKLGQ